MKQLNKLVLQHDGVYDHILDVAMTDMMEDFIRLVIDAICSNSG